MKSPLREKSYKFAVQIIKLSQELTNKKEFILSKQLVRSGTAIGAILREADYASSKLDFIYKFSLSLKEANETEYWLMLLYDTDYISKENFNKLRSDCKELIAMLVAALNTLKKGKTENK